MAKVNAYEFDYGGKHYRWDRSTLRSPEGRAEIQRVLGERVKELSYLGYTAGYEVMKDMTTARNVIQALGGNVTEPILRAIETDIVEKMMNAPAQEETEVAVQPTDETAAPTAPGLENVRGMNAIASTTEGRIALQRWRNGQDLDPAQRRLVDDYRALEKAHNDAADASRVSKEPRKNLSTYIPGDVMPWATNQNKVQRLQQAAEHRVKVLNNPEHPYWKASHGEHRAAVLGMKIAQEMLQNGGDSFVHIKEDGSIEDEK
jgi:hypothetical protein